MSHHTWNDQDALRAQGYRVTPQRELLMDLICAARARPSAGHHHLVCRGCGREVEVAGEETEALFEALAARTVSG